MGGSDRNYKYGPKNNWRRTIWNEVLSRTAGRERNELVLYLAGPQDLDRQVAIDKGVPAENLIAIDRDGDNIARIRATQQPAIQAKDIKDVLWAWPDSRPVCAVILDYCSGLEEERVGVYDTFQRRALRNAVVAINLQRGRDSWSNELRFKLYLLRLLDFDNIGDHRGDAMTLIYRAITHADTMECPPSILILTGKLLEVNKEALTEQRVTWEISAEQIRFSNGGIINARDGLYAPLIPTAPEAKHRAYQFLVTHAVDILACAVTGGVKVEDEAIKPLVARIVGAMKPRFFSYRSWQLVFDSAVFEPIWKLQEFAPKEAERQIQQLSVANTVKGVAGRIRAMLAVRTMRSDASNR